MKNILVTVIVPIYNAEKYLDVCLESIINQTYANLEIILVDDGSVDSSLSICEKWQKKDSRINVIHQTNRGVGKARNIGLDNAKGEYIAFVDADDLISNNYIEFLVNMAVEYNCDISYCSYLSFDKLEEIEQYKQENQISQCIDLNSGTEAIKNFFSLWIGPNVCTKLIKKTLFDNVRFSDAQRAEDMEIVYKLVYSAKTVVGNKYAVLYYYRQNPQSAMSTISSKSLVDFDIRLEIYKFLRNDKENDFDVTTKKIARQTMRFYFDMLCVKRNKIGDWITFNKELKAIGKSLANEMFFEDNNAMPEKCLLLIHPRLWKYYKIIERKIQILMHKETLY